MDYKFSTKDIVNDLHTLHGIDVRQSNVNYYINKLKLIDKGVVVKEKAERIYYDSKENITKIGHFKEYRINQQGKTLLTDLFIANTKKKKEAESIVCPKVKTPIEILEELEKANSKELLHIKISDMSKAFLNMMSEATGKSKDDYINTMIEKEIKSIFKDK